MPPISPLAIVLFIILILAFVGAVVAYISSERTYRGYKDIATDARRLRNDIRGELFRDGDDLVVSGKYHGIPTVIRFSHGEHTPGMNIHVNVPSTLDLIIVPRGARELAGKVEIKTGDNVFDSRFTSRADQPEEARMLLDRRGTLAEVRKLCCSSRTYLRLAKGDAEVTELTIPENVYRHAIDHLASLDRLSQALKEMPGSDKIVVKPITRQKHVFGRIAIAIGIVAAVLAISATMRYSGKSDQSENPHAPAIPAGIAEEHAALIPNLADMRLATDSDFSGDAVGWMRSQNRTPSGKVDAKFSGPDAIDEAAYILLDKSGAYRVVILAKGKVAYDEGYPKVGIAAKVPRAQVENIDWVGRPPETPDGDGLLLLRNPDDKASGLVIFLQGSRVVTAVPSNYQAIHLE